MMEILFIVKNIFFPDYTTPIEYDNYTNKIAIDFLFEFYKILIFIKRN